MVLRSGPHEGDSLLESPVWYELADDHSVVELRRSVTSAPVLALHVVIDTEADATIAWWETDNGMWVAVVGTT